jgi:hypothetical protein
MMAQVQVAVAVQREKQRRGREELPENIVAPSTAGQAAVGCLVHQYQQRMLLPGDDHECGQHDERVREQSRQPERGDDQRPIADNCEPRTSREQ